MDRIIRSSWRPTILAAAGLALALAGQLALDRRAALGPEPGWLLLLTGALLAAAGLASYLGDARAIAWGHAPAAWPRPGQALVLAGALLLAAAAVPGFVRLAQVDGHDEPAGNWAWLLWLAGAAVFALAALPGQQSAVSSQPSALSPQPSAVSTRTAHRALRIAHLVLVTRYSLLVVLAAAALRFVLLDSVPRGLWADEAIAGLQAEDILAHGWRPLFIGGLNGEPALYLYGLAPLIAWLGPTVLALRLPMALAGTLAVPALAWVLGPVYGRRIAWLAAALLAAMTWQINFSRIAFNATWSLPVDLLAAGCLLRALAGGRVRWYAWAGLLFGLGFQLYYISRAWLLLCIVLLGYRLLTERGLWRAARQGLVWTATGLLIGVAPVAVYAAVQPADYLARASAVAATPALAQAGSPAPLFASLLTHLAMWNQAGDPNGRHNLPGARMLDVGTAVLLPCGAALAAIMAGRLRRGRRPGWPGLFPLAGLVLLLAGGVLSAPDESPQALRTLGDTNMVALLAALPLAALWRLADRWRPQWPRAGALLVGALLLIVCAANVRRYFWLQEPNPDVYKAFSTPATLVAEMVAAHGPETDDFVAMGLYEQATIEYLRGHAAGTPFTSLAETPLPPGAPGHPAALFLDNRNYAALDYLQTLYSHATVTSVTGPQGGNALFFALQIPAADRAAPYKIDLTLRDGQGATRTVTQTGGLAVDWAGVNLTGLTLPLQATWHGTLRPPASGVYDIAVEHTAGPADRTSLDLAGRALVPGGTVVPLIAGRYPFTLTVAVTAAQGATRLRWAATAGPTSAAGVTATQVVSPAALLAPLLGVHGVTATYRNGTAADGPAGLVREEPLPSWFFFYTPFGVGPFVGQWQGTLVAPRSGRYHFDVDIGGVPDLWLDGRPLAWQPAGRSALNVPLFGADTDLTAGPHTFRFQDRAPTWREPCILFWTPPGGPRSVIPTTAFGPDLWAGQ